jgi:GAF domain-containing protein
VALAPAGLAWILAAEGTTGIDIGGDVLTFAASAAVFTTIGQAMQRTRRSLEREIARSNDQYDESRKRSSERELLAELGRIVAQSPDVRKTYERFAESVRTMLPADRITVSVYDKTSDLLTTTYISGPPIANWEEGAPHALNETLLENVIRDRQSLLLTGPDYSSSAIKSVLAGAEVGLKSAAAVPLLHRGEVIGTLGLRSTDEYAYNAESVVLLEQIGTQIASAVVNAALYTTLEREGRERAVLAEISRILSASPEIADVYEEFVVQVGKLVRWDRISVNVVEHETNRLRTAYAAGAGVDEYPTGEYRPPGTRSILEHVATTGESLLVEKIEDMLDRFPDSVIAFRAGLRSGIYVPLISDGVVIGTLAAGVKESLAYTEADLKLLQRMAEQIAGTFANAELRMSADRRAQEETTLAVIGRIMTSSLQIDEIYDEFAEQVRVLMPADRVSIIEIYPALDELMIRYVSGMNIPSSTSGTRRKLHRDGLLQTVARSGHGLLVTDLSAQISRFPDAAPVAESGVRSALYSPLRSQGEVIGILCIASREVGVHDEYQLELLERVSARIAGALASARLHELADRQANEEAVLAEISRIVNSSLDIETVYEQFAEQVSRILKFDRIAITRVGPGEDEYTISHVMGVDIPELGVGSVWKMDETPFGPVLRDGETLFFQDSRIEDHLALERGMVLSIAAGIKSSLVVPLIEQNRPVGFISIRSIDDDAYTESDAVLARRVAALVSSAITNAELLNRSNRQAREEAAIGEIGRTISSSLMIEEVYDQFAEQLLNLMPAHRVSVIEVEPETGEMNIRHVSEFPPDSPQFGQHHQWRPNGLMEFVARTGESLAYPDVGARIVDVPAARSVFNSGVRSLLYTPLRSQSQVIGILCVVSAEVGVHTEEHFELLERISAQIAGALANARLHERSDQQAREEFALGEIGRIVNSSLDIDEIYDQFAEQVQQILPFDRMAIAVRVPGQTHYRISHVTGVVVPGLEVGTVREITKTNLVPLFEQKKILLQQGGKAQDEFVLGENEGLSSSLIVPLIAREEAIGFIALRSETTDAYKEEHAALAQRIATLASRAISNSNLYERAESEATERTVLAEIGRIVGSSLDIDSVYPRVADQFRKLIDFDRISISYVNSSRSSAVYAWAEGETQTGFGTGREIPIKAFVGTRLGQFMRRRKGAVLDEAEIKEFFDRLPWSNETNARSMICVPLVSGGRTFAGLAVTSLKPDAYGDRELEIVTRVGGQVAGAVANARLHGELQDASDELKDINTQKTDLMTTVAHELRSPLTAFSAFVDLVLDGTAGEVPEKQLDLLLKASRSSVRMQNILNVFSHLEMAEDTSVPLTVTMFDIENLVASALDLFQAAARHAGVTVKFERAGNLPMVEGDRQAIDQVISNLISNAIKYSREGGHVLVKCVAHDDDVIVSVVDTGLGISVEDQERLFERFYRGSDPVKIRIPGTGLGLYVSKGLVGRHGGRIWCQSEKGNGAEFSFAIPFELPAEETIPGNVPAA